MPRIQCVVLATLIIARCGDPAAPPASPGVILAVRLSATHAAPGETLFAEAFVANRLGGPILYAQGCGEEDGIWFEVFGPGGRRVLVESPGVRPACVTRVAALLQGARIESTLPFDGTLYDAEGQAYLAPAGRYVVVARFRWWRSTSETESVVLEERTTFVWEESAKS